MDCCYNNHDSWYEIIQVIKMGMPTSLNGMIGFIIFIVFIVAIVAPNTTTNEQNVIDAQNVVRDQLNSRKSVV